MNPDLNSGMHKNIFGNFTGRRRRP